MTQRAFKQVDVFTATPYLGNPLAVVLDGTGLSDEAMRGFAAWTNLSETTFLLPPTQLQADYRVRIFTPSTELPFAGHPTLGSCHAWLQAGGQPKGKDCIVQECAVGLVQVRREVSCKAPQEVTRLAFAAPPVKRSAPQPSQLAQIATALGLKADQIQAAQWLDNGPVWLGLLLDSPQTVLALKPDHLALKNLGVAVGVVGIEPAPAPSALIARSSREAKAFAASPVTGAAHTPPALTPAAIEVRAFAAALGVVEDPATGSLNASLAQWLIAEGHAPAQYVATQGTCLNRFGQVHILRDAGGQVWVGGDTVTCIDGRVTL